MNFAGVGGIGNPGYTAPITMAEKSVCDPCFQKIGGGLLQYCLPLLPLPLFDDEVGPQEPCESGAGTALQFIACMQDALEDVTDVVSEPLEELGDIGEDIGEDMGGDFGAGLSGGAGALGDGLEAVGDILGKIQCLTPLLDPCAFGGGNGSGAGSAGGRLAAASVSLPPPITAPLTNRILQALASGRPEWRGWRGVAARAKHRQRGLVSGAHGVRRANRIKRAARPAALFIQLP